MDAYAPSLPILHKLRPKRPMPFPDHCTCFAIRRAARHVSQGYDRALAPTGLRTTQFSLLSTLDRHGPRNLAALADALLMDRTTMSRAVRPLERDGLVAVGPDPDDGRGRILRITGAGRARLEQARPLWAQAEARQRAAYGEERSRQLHALLDDLVRVAPAGAYGSSPEG